MNSTEDPQLPEIPPGLPEAQPGETGTPIRTLELVPAEKEPAETRALLWVLWGSRGLRAGWSILTFVVLFSFLASGVGYLFFHFHLASNQKNDVTAGSAFFSELIFFLAMVGAAAIVALIERRRGNLLAYNLSGPGGGVRFLSGFVSGFAALSVLIGALSLGGWLHFGIVALSGFDILKYALIWAGAFLLVASVEEGLFRCYLQFTLTRGINFWWALGVIALICGDLVFRGKGNGIWGIYGIAALGLVPCLVLHLKKAAGSGFWQATWVTSTLFGFIHTSNNGENWIGIFAAALIGFAFCVSLWATGSAWWAIGCHAAWDWAETYFYGAADSGNVASGHYLTTSPAGAALWSGGTDGPEGSVLVIPVVLLLMVIVLVFFRRGKIAAQATPAMSQASQPA
jgi:membrane protease YdiL (CAAX protease family)